MTRLLRRLVNLLSEEADRNPDFAAKLDDLVASAPRKVGPSKTRAPGKAETAVPDIYSEFQSRGEEEFRFWLRDQPVSLLRAIIRKHDLDSPRRTVRWKDAEKLSSFIADRLQARLDRGASFIRGSQNEEN